MADTVKDLDRTLRLLSQEWRIRELAGRRAEAKQTWAQIEDLLDKRFQLQTRRSVSA